MRNKERGFTLVEIAITLLIVSILALGASSLGKNWGDSHKVNEANVALGTAYDIAKSRALSNAQAQTIGSTLVLDQDSICVKEGAVSSIDCDGGYVWKKVLKATVVLGGSSSSCISLDSAAIPVASGSCVIDTSYSVERGAQNASGELI